MTGSPLKTPNQTVMTILIVVGILFAYVNQFSPAPFIPSIAETFGIDVVTGQAQINFSISVMFICAVISAMIGGTVERKIGTRNLYVWTLGFMIAGMLLTTIATNFSIFFSGRVLYGLGFGLSIPFIGSAIMKWYDPKQREHMNTVNGMFPFVGTVISFGFLIYIAQWLGGSWQYALGAISLPMIIVLILWPLMIDKSASGIVPADCEVEEEQEKGLYINLWKRRSMKLLSTIFICDFTCYAYVGAILPMLLMNSGMMEGQAGFWAAVAFPGFGIAGCLFGGIVNSTSGKRRPTMAVGQLLKFIGIVVVSFAGSMSVWWIVVGAALFGLGNSMWMPGFYMVAMELEDMTPTRVGAAFAMMTSAGFIAGTISPPLGGWISQLLIVASSITEQAAQLAYGMTWSLFIFGFLNLIGFVCVLMLKETGPAVSTEPPVTQKATCSSKV